MIKFKRLFLLITIFYIIALFVHPRTAIQTRSLTTLGPPTDVIGDGEYYFELTKSIAVNKQLHIYENLSEVETRPFLLGLSLGTHGRIYSLYAPGLSFLAVPFYFLGPLGAYLLTALLGLGILYFIHKTLLMFVDEETSVKTVLFFAFGSTILTYSHVFYSEILGAFLVITSFYFLLKSIKETSIRGAFIAGLVAGYIPLSKVTLFVIPIIYLVYLARKQSRLIVPFLFGLVIFTMVLFWYNTVSFGNPLKTGYSTDIVKTDNGVHVRNLTGLRYWGNNPLKTIPGQIIILALTQPLLLISYRGIVKFFGREEVKLIATIFFVLLVIYGMRFDPFGLWSWSSRYMVPVVPLLALPFSLVVEKTPRKLLNFIVYASVVLTISSLSFGTWWVFTNSPVVRFFVKAIV